MEKPNVRIWVLLAVCIVCVLSAKPLGFALGWSYEGRGISTLNTGAVAVWTSSIYLLGVISFAWAAVERIAMAVERSKG